MEWKANCYRVGSHQAGWDDIPAEGAEEYDRFVSAARKRIEPWLSAIFQSDHLNLLLGSGFTAAIGHIAGAGAANMNRIEFRTDYDDRINAHATNSAEAMGRGTANIEDQFRSALAVLEGLMVLNPVDAATLKSAMDREMRAFLATLLATEEGIANGADETRLKEAQRTLQSFLLSFASRTPSRERLHIFTTNYERLIEHGCDLAGLRIIDRFVGALTPVFRSSRVEVDIHYNPPGIRGEPRFIEGVIRLSKLHGSLDWHFHKDQRLIRRKGIPFGAPADHTDMPAQPIDTVMIYPNPAKDVETTQYPYAELFRDYAAAVCRPNSVAITYGYGFGDDHINRVLLDMLTIPSTHLVIIARDPDARLKGFCDKVAVAQVSLLIGPHFASISELVENYLPKPALDYITGRMTDLLNRRPQERPPVAGEPAQQPTAAIGAAAPARVRGANDDTN